MCATRVVNYSDQAKLKYIGFVRGSLRLSLYYLGKGKSLRGLFLFLLSPSRPFSSELFLKRHLILLLALVVIVLQK